MLTLQWGQHRIPLNFHKVLGLFEVADGYELRGYRTVTDLAATWKTVASWADPSRWGATRCNLGFLPTRQSGPATRVGGTVPRHKSRQTFLNSSSRAIAQKALRLGCVSPRDGDISGLGRPRLADRFPPRCPFQ